MTNEMVHFRLIICPECSHNLCWVNPRLPTFCPECGKLIYAELRLNPDKHVLINDEKAWIKYGETNVRR